MMRHTFGALMLIGALGSTAFVPAAQAAIRDRRAPVARFYDRGQRDDQTWGASERRAYRDDLSNGYRPYRTFSRLHGTRAQESRAQESRGWWHGR
jgi:hypothetical protein